eukprot:TRINITY_DN608_c0_g1_i9.p1 TRINITY_DN608_c0_g1~~TRINITY_DN608_c0_g1_i9.p1  ORF type:complete len:752 (+),score=101.93 TRINITY_DN608_c0_g1_i9:304-2256(+)
MTKPCMAVLNSFMKLNAYQTGACRVALEKRLYANEVRSSSLCATREEEELCAKIFYPYKKLLQEMRCMCQMQADHMYTYGQRNKETDVCTIGFEDMPDVHYLEHCFDTPKPQQGYHLFSRPDFTCMGSKRNRFNRYYRFENRFAQSQEFLKNDDLYDILCHEYSEKAEESLPNIGEDCQDVPVPYHPLTCKEIVKYDVCDSIDTEIYCQYSCTGCSLAPSAYNLTFCNMTVHDCECVEGEWLYDTDGDGDPETYRGCAKTVDEQRGYWCPLGHPGTCTNGNNTMYRTYEFCYPETCARQPAVNKETARADFTDIEICATTRNLCECEAKWQFDVNLDGENETYSGCAHVPQGMGAWCMYTDSSTCRNPERAVYPQLGMDYCFEVNNCTHLNPEVKTEDFDRFPRFVIEGDECTPPCLEGPYPQECKILDKEIDKLQKYDLFCNETRSEAFKVYNEEDLDCPTYGVCQLRTETLVKLKMRQGCFCYKEIPDDEDMCETITGAAEHAMKAWNVTQSFCDDREMNIPIEEELPDLELEIVPSLELPAKPKNKQEKIKQKKKPGKDQKDKTEVDELLEQLVENVKEEEVEQEEGEQDPIDVQAPTSAEILQRVIEENNLADELVANKSIKNYQLMDILDVFLGFLGTLIFVTWL